MRQERDKNIYIKKIERAKVEREKRGVKVKPRIKKSKRSREEAQDFFGGGGIWEKTGQAEKKMKKNKDLALEIERGKRDR
jgi:hypothetical protein